MNRILAQLNPNATTATSLYTVPINSKTVVVSLFVCNQAAAAGTFRVWVVKNFSENAATSPVAKQYLYYDKAIGANDIQIIDKIYLTGNDSIGIYASSGSQSFTLFGEDLPV